MSLSSTPGSSQYGSVPPLAALSIVAAAFVLPLVIAAYGFSHGWWGVDPHQARMSAKFLAVAFSIASLWCIASGFLTHAVWSGIASVWLLRLAVPLPGQLLFSVLNWHRSGPLLLTVTVAEACGFALGVWLGAKIFTGWGKPRIS
jgi:hypothetical protein